MKARSYSFALTLDLIERVAHRLIELGRPRRSHYLISLIRRDLQERVLHPMPGPFRARRCTVSLPEDLKEAVDRRVAELGLRGFSHYIQALISFDLTRRRR